MMDQKTLHSIIHYDPLSGEFTWRDRSDIPSNINSRIRGKKAGSVKESSGIKYLEICVYKRRYYAHRLAILYVTGNMPNDAVDHKDGDGLNNRFLNLRPATKGQNNANSGAKRNSITGIKGVHPFRGRFRAKFKNTTLGYADTPEELVHLYQRAERKAFGEFAR